MDINYDTISVPVSSRINKTFWFNNKVGVLCGGEKSKEGYIYKTIDEGRNWTKCYGGNFSLYDIIFTNDTLGFCCGENMEILRTHDAGKTWQKITKENNYDKFYNGTLYGMFQLYNRVYFFGGKNFNIGFINRAQSDSMLDGFKGFSNELRCGIPINMTSYLACGYGQCYKTSDDSQTFAPFGLRDDYFTASCKINNNNYVFCGFNGGVFMYNNEENKVSQLLESKKLFKKEMHFNGIYFTSETKGWVVGNDGLMMKTEDGKKFTQLDLKTKSNLISIVSNHNNKLIISSENGELLKIDY